MFPGSRRQFLALVGTGVSGLGVPPAPRRTGRMDGSFGDGPAFPPPHVIDLERGDLAFDRESAFAGDQVSVPIDDPVVHRVWDPAEDETVDVTEYSPAGGEVTVRPYEGDRDDAIDMLYRRQGNGDLSYLFDIGSTPGARERVRAEANDDPGNRYVRSFEDHGVTTTARLDTVGRTNVSVAVPYSLYRHGLRSNLGTRAPMVPTPGDNGFDPTLHRPLLETLADSTTEVVEGAGDDVADYCQAAVLAEFVQSIPHVTDWESKREIHYVRTPEEALAELHADCKDASLLLYHLLEGFGFDPALVFLIGDVPSVALDASAIAIDRVVKRDDQKSDTTRQMLEYPHHLAVAVPAQQVTPMPDGIDQQETFERDGQEYVYIESTNRRPPGVYHDSLPRLTSVIYRSRQGFLEQLVSLA